MTKTHALSLISAFVLTTSCSATPTAESETKRIATDRETEVVQTSALDFLKSVDCREGSGRAGILVAEETDRAGVSLSDEWLHDVLPSEMWSQVGPFLGSFRQENRRDFLMDWQFSAQDITVADLRQATYKTFHMMNGPEQHVHCIAWFAIPVFAPDNQSAFVAFDVGPEEHGRTVMYLLRRSDDGWTIAQRHVFDFL